MTVEDPLLLRVEIALGADPRSGPEPGRDVRRRPRRDRRGAWVRVRIRLGGRPRRRRWPPLRPDLGDVERRRGVRGRQRGADARAGRGPPGPACGKSGAPAWINDAPTAGNFPRADAARRAGLRAAFFRSAAQLPPAAVVGAIEFFARELREPDEALLASLTVLGNQLGEYVARQRAEQELRKSESRVRAMLESAFYAAERPTATTAGTSWSGTPRPNGSSVMRNPRPSGGTWPG